MDAIRLVANQNQELKRHFFSVLHCVHNLEWKTIMKAINRREITQKTELMRNWKLLGLCAGQGGHPYHDLFFFCVGHLTVVEVIPLAVVLVLCVAGICMEEVRGQEKISKSDIWSFFCIVHGFFCIGKDVP